MNPQDPNQPQNPEQPSAPLTSPAMPVNNPQPNTPTTVTGSNPQDYAAMPSGVPPKAKGRKLLLGLVGLVAVVLLGVGGYLFYLSTLTITAKDVATARTVATTLRSDLHDVSTALSNLDISGGSTTVDSDVSTINTKLTDAEKQYDLLKNSPVQRDADTKQKFAALNEKWPTFTQYIKDETKDIQTLNPITTELGKKITALVSKPPKTTTELAAYLTSYKAIIDDASSKVGSAHLSVAENQQIADTLKTFLEASSSAVTKAQQDLAAGSASAASSDLLKIQTAQTTYTTKLRELQGKLADKENQINPLDQYVAFVDQLDKLAQKVK